MVHLMHWTGVSLLAVTACGFVIPREADLSLASLIRNSNPVRRHMKSIFTAMSNTLPYSEGLLQESESFKLNDLSKDERKCLYLRKSFGLGGTVTALDINPHADYPDQVTGDEATILDITTSLAKVDMARVGWNKEASTELGASATVEASGGFGPFSASLSATVSGNQRTTSGQNGESSTQTEYRNDMRYTKTCPKNSICRIITWTYTRTISGSCFLTPYLDAKCLGVGTGNYGLAMLPTCEPVRSIASQFYSFNSTTEPSPNFGVEFQGIKMRRREFFTTAKYVQDCTFSHVLRTENGDPIRAQALIIESDQSQDAVKKSEVNGVPKAYKWVEGADGEKYCNLERGWSWQPGDYYYIPKSDGGLGNWEHRPDLPKPEGLDEKCPKDTKLSARAEVDRDNVPPRNNLIKLEIITDTVSMLAAPGQKVERKESVPSFWKSMNGNHQQEIISVPVTYRASAKECLSELRASLGTKGQS